MLPFGPPQYATLASISALHEINVDALPTSLSSQTMPRQVETSHAAGSSQDSDVLNLISVTSLGARFSVWLDKQARRGVVISILWGQENR